MTTFDRKINQIAARHGWSIEKQPRAAVPCYIIAAPTYEDTGKIVAVLNRCKGLHHETLTPIHYESWAVKVYDAGQIAAYRERERQKAALVDAFYMALKANGGDQNAAKAAHGKRATKKEVGAAAGRVYLFFRVILPGRSFFRGVVRGGRLESIAGHSFPRGVHNIPRHAFPGVGGGCVQILFNFFRDSN